MLYLQHRLQVENLYDRTDIIVISDHGMLTTKPMHFIDLYRFVDRNTVEMFGRSPVLQVVANQPHRQHEICHKLKKAGRRDTRFTAYDIKSLPSRWRIQNAQRFGPCVVVANPPCAFQDYNVQDWFPEVKSACLSPSNK